MIWKNVCTHDLFLLLIRKELLLRLQRLHQGPRKVDEYFKDLETTLTKINIHDSEESKITRFVSGLRREIKDVVELYEYSSLKKLVHLAIKVESHILTKTSFKATHHDGFYKSPGKDKNNISTTISPSNFSKKTIFSYNVFKDKPSTSTLKSPTKPSRTKWFKCLGFGHIAVNCPNKRTPKLKEEHQGQIKTKTKSENERENEGQDNTGSSLQLKGVFLSCLFHYLNILNTWYIWLRSLGMIFKKLLTVIIF